MKKKNSSKFLLVLIIIGLVSWNVYLTVQMNQINPSTSTVTNTTVNKVVSEISNNLTEVVNATQDKVAVVYNYQQDTLYGSGSGVVYAVDGYDVTVVTNHHVIDGSDTVQVKFANGEIFEATLVGSDAYSDLAVLKLTVDFEIEAFNLGDSSLTSVGEQVLAIGSPLGEEYQGSVTYGIISGKDRTISVDLDGNGTEDWDMLVLQTDAAINPGNSGGALVNLAGELIGIPSSKIQSSNGESVEGMGFAIPINEVTPIVQQIIDTGTVTRPTFGISAVALSDLSDFQKVANGIDADQEGLYITGVTSGGPAESAGLKTGDIIVEFDGQDVTGFKEFRKQLYTKSVGDKVNVSVLRNGETITLEVTLG